MQVSSPFRLVTEDPAPFALINADGKAPAVLVCEHAGRLLPAALAERAPSPEEMTTHVAWDVGAADLAVALADRLDAPLAIQPYSRLAIDCNRPRHAHDLAPCVSDGIVVPFNQNLAEPELDARWGAIHRPFHQAIAGLLDRRAPAAVVAVHSFTPRMRNGGSRQMDVGLLARAEPILAEALRARLLGFDPTLKVVRNEPYRIEDDTDYTIPEHGERRGLPHVLIEVRSDRIDHPAGLARLAALLAEALDGTLAGLLTGG